MKKTLALAAALMLVLGAGLVSWAQQTGTPPPATGQARTPQAEKATQPDRVVVPLSNPAKPAKVEASVMRGSITVKGYEGKDVIVEARVRERSLNEEPFAALALADRAARNSGNWAIPKTPRVPKAPSPALAMLMDDEKQDKKERSHEGMKLITAALTGLQVEEQDNVVSVNTESWKYAVDMTIQVPVSSSLEIGSMNDGTIIVENVNGELEINGGSGSVTLRNVSGNVVAHTMNGDIEAVLNRLSGDKPLSFSNMNGDIDVTLPADIKATVRLKSQMGNIYSDFDIALKPAPAKAEESEKTERGQFRVSFDKGIYGTINGGGQEISFTTFNGEIFLRKKK